MKFVSNFNFKIFLFSGVTFGLLMSASDYIDGEGFKIWKFLFLAISFGGMMALVNHKNDQSTDKK